MEKAEGDRDIVEKALDNVTSIASSTRKKISDASKTTAEDEPVETDSGSIQNAPEREKKQDQPRDDQSQAA